MVAFISLSEAVAAHIRDGQTLSLEGFTHLIPFAAGHEIIRQGRRRLTLVRMTPDIIYDQMIGMGCAESLVFSWGGNPGVGSLHRLRDAIQNQWPGPLHLDERSHAAMAAAYQAGASGLPFGMLAGFLGSDLPTVNPNIRFITCPYTQQKLSVVPALRPDVSIIHAHSADRSGNVLLKGIVGVQKEAALAAGKVIVTVEQLVDQLHAHENSVVLPHWVISAICHVPGGAHPSYVHGLYDRDNAFYRDWDEVSRDREGFLGWMDRHVMQCVDHQAYLSSLGDRA
jgi:glutaconate CoA-transferase subunit A